MATKLFLRNTANNGIGNYFDMNTTAGSASDTGVVNTTASGTEIQWTQTAGGTVLEFISGRAPAGGFTLSGTMTFSIWANESNMNANCGARSRVFKRSGGVDTEVGGGPYSDGVEFGTGATEMVWTGTPTSTAFAEDDRIIVKYYITNVGTMGGGFTCTLTYNAADASTGDSFFQINETVTFKSEDLTLSPSLFTNTNTFFSPTVTSLYTLSPPLFTNTNSFFDPTVTSLYTITPGLFTNTNTFFAPTVSPGPVTISPGLFTNTNSFFTPTVTATYIVSPDLFTNTNTFFAHTVSSGNIQDLQPALFTNTNTFFSPTVTVGNPVLRPELFVNPNTFFTHTIEHVVDNTIHDIPFAIGKPFVVFRRRRSPL